MTYYSHGKLLLTGEYLVLDGAMALALPTKKGQSLEVKSYPSHNRKLEWKSISDTGEVWFEALFDKNFQVLHHTDQDIVNTLQHMLISCALLNPDFLMDANYYEVSTRLEFNRQWGLGSSSTLLANLAEWAKVSPYELLEQSFSGSGYDLACAKAKGPLFFQRQAEMIFVKEVEFNPVFKDQIWFVYLEKKQKSSREILRYKELEFDKATAIEKASTLSKNILTCDTVESFNAYLKEHETLISNILQTSRIKDHFFSDYEHGEIKSLGAWGGDFILVTGNKEHVLPYFQGKGYQTIVSWGEMIL